MIALHSISLEVGARTLVRDATLTIARGDRIGLVGANGVGKSTLLKVVAGERSVDGGDRVVAKSTTIGYLAQEAVELGRRSVIDEVASAAGDAFAIEKEIDEVTDAMATYDHTSEEYSELLHKLGDLHHRMESSGGFRLRADVEIILAGLGFKPGDGERPAEEFSGGWRMRIALAKLLIAKPDILLLDEPTNHLDLASLEWLENHLQLFEGGVVLVSHDRAFLNALIRRTIEISRGELTEYSGNYDTYVELKAERIEQLEAAYENQQIAIKHQEKFIEKFRYKATKSRQVQSRVKMLDRMQRIELDNAEDVVHFTFPAAPQAGIVILEIENLSKSYGSNLVLDNVSLVLERGDRVAFVGDNGQGKSTMARIIIGEEEITSGKYKLGYNVKVGYYAQHQADSLDVKRTVLETLDSVAQGEVRTRLRKLLGAFLFRGDDVQKRVGVLSGGEKSRLALAKLLLEPVNLLVLDEPTNHLDMRSKAVLKEALLDFEGAMILVSHDRDFLDGLVTKVIEFRDRKIHVHLGSLSEYLEKVHARNEAAAASKAALPNAKPVAQGLSKEQKRLEAEERNKKNRETKPLRDKLSKLEKEIAAAEAQKKSIEAEMADPSFYENVNRSQMQLSVYSHVGDKLKTLYAEWEQVTEKVEKANS